MVNIPGVMMPVSAKVSSHSTDGSRATYVVTVTSNGQELRYLMLDMNIYFIKYYTGLVGGF